MAAFEDPNAVFTKDPTRTSFANRIRNNQLDHESRIGQNETDIAALQVTPLAILDFQSTNFLWESGAGGPRTVDLGEFVAPANASMMEIRADFTGYDFGPTGDPQGFGVGQYVVRLSDGCANGQYVGSGYSAAGSETRNDWDPWLSAIGNVRNICVTKGNNNTSYIQIKRIGNLSEFRVELWAWLADMSGYYSGSATLKFM